MNSENNTTIITISNNPKFKQTNKLASSNNELIHEFNFNFICDFFINTPRQGPGSPEVTLKALSFIDNLTDKSLIADIGCGTGGQTMILARNAPGYITGIDLFPGFINKFNENTVKLNLQDKATGIVCSMENLPFEEEGLDLIWSEGAIYNIGFERGLNEWHKYLKTDGYIAVSDVSWFTEKRPKEIHNYCIENFPEMDTIPDKVALVQKAGYIPISTFILPTTCWTDHYFNPLIKAQEIFLNKYPGNKNAEKFVQLQRQDAELYRKYNEFYGYVFYIAKKRKPCLI